MHLDVTRRVRAYCRKLIGGGGGGRYSQPMLVRVLLGLGVAVVVSWLALLVALLVAHPRGSLLTEALRLLPDVVRLLRRLAVDRTLPRSVKVRLWLLVAYLAIPIDLVPDFIPIPGYADDAIIVTWVLRSVVRRAGLAPLRRHWPGTPDSLAAVVACAGWPIQAQPRTPPSRARSTVTSPPRPRPERWRPAPWRLRSASLRIVVLIADGRVGRPEWRRTAVGGGRGRLGVQGDGVGAEFSADRRL